jgi:outer membrane immunogenic protein
MRRLFLAAMMIGAMSSARAADLPVLRGGFTDGLTRTSVNWAGFYVGAQAGYQSADVDFSNTVTALAAFIFRNSVLTDPTSNWKVLGPAHAQGTSFGAFAGYNWQFDDAVVGLEANYTYFKGLSATSANSIARAIANPTGENPPAGHTHTYNTSVTGGAGMEVHDLTTVRARAGWIVGEFMPYGFAGVAVGRLVPSRFVSTTVTLTDEFTDIIGNPQRTTSLVPSVSQTIAESRSSFVQGWVAGLGLEYSVVGGLFVRAEWEYTAFLSVKDTLVQMNALRAGLGYKF